VSIEKLIFGARKDGVLNLEPHKIFIENIFSIKYHVVPGNGTNMLYQSNLDFAFAI
jgi:hypothetical protein